MLPRLSVRRWRCIRVSYGKAAPGNEEYESENQRADDVVLQGPPLEGPHEDVPDGAPGFRHQIRVLPNFYRSPSSPGSYARCPA